MVRRLSVPCLALVMGSSSPYFTIRDSEDRSAVRTVHLAGNVAGRHTDSHVPCANDHHPLVDSVDWAHPIRGIAHRGFQPQSNPSNSGVGFANAPKLLYFL